MTFMAIVWYSWETHLLKKETQWATETSIRPFLALDFVDVSSPSGEWPHQYRLEMQNIGKGAAFKVVGVLELIVDLKDTKESKQINLIPVAEKGLGTWPIAIFDGQKLSGTVRLDYSDVMGKKFHTICTIGVVEKSKPNLSLSKWGYS